ncbi:FCD domain-containing protein [Microbacterium sp. NPDC019599]|uniref:FadR/GntR family transcriptional regulator n=1 Tax=Microbacterium sp. NPDC019599 TaxID=3154690 RepID=UPI0033E26B26
MDEHRARSQTDVVIDGVRDMILDGSITAGSRLPVEKDLCEQLGVSRGSLREGVRALVRLGVLETRQGDGTYVTDLDAATLFGPLSFLADLQTPEASVHLLTVRRILEPEAAALAATNIDDDALAAARAVLDRGDALLAEGDIDLEATIDVDAAFHAVVARASGNPAIEALVQALIGRTARARLWRAIHEAGAVERTQREHRAILAALEDGDASKARIRMAVHVLGVEEYTASQFVSAAAED